MREEIKLPKELTDAWGLPETTIVKNGANKTMIQATGKNNRIYLTISDKSKFTLTPSAARQIISVITIAMIDLIDRANADLAEAQNSYDREDEDEKEEGDEE